MHEELENACEKLGLDQTATYRLFGTDSKNRPISLEKQRKEAAETLVAQFGNAVLAYYDRHPSAFKIDPENEDAQTFWAQMQSSTDPAIASTDVKKTIQRFNNAELQRLGEFEIGAESDDDIDGEYIIKEMPDSPTSPNPTTAPNQVIQSPQPGKQPS